MFLGNPNLVTENFGKLYKYLKKLFDFRLTFINIKAVE